MTSQSSSGAMEKSGESSKSVPRAFVSFPSPYTQTLILQALVSTLPEVAISLITPEQDADHLPELQWADYDLMDFEVPHSNPSKYLTSSYVYRKALIRKHQLHRTILEYLAKCEHRNVWSALRDAWPTGWNIELQFVDELEEMWVDDLYELGEALDGNADLPDGAKQWFILKPGFADRAQGIRLFSSKEELEAIFEAFENEDSDDDDTSPEGQLDKFRDLSAAADATIEGMRNRSPRDNTFDEKLERWKRRIEESSDEEEDDESDKVAGSASKLAIGASGGTSGEEANPDQRADTAVERPPSGNERGAVDDDEHEGSEEEELDTGVMTSQLRHFLIQEYIRSPILFDIDQKPNRPLENPQGYKFHLRAYVLVTGAYTVHLSRTMLALFSGSPYVHPASRSTADEPSSENGNLDLRPHLTNTCLQTDAFGALAPPEELIKLFWDLEGFTALSRQGQGYKGVGTVDREWLDKTFNKVGNVVGEAVKAGAECGTFGLQLVPNAFEIFGVDLLLSIPPMTTLSLRSQEELPVPVVTLMEFNASPDFHQSGMNLRPHLLEMFKSVVEISVKPFFDLESVSRQRDSEPTDGQDAGAEGRGEGGAIGKETMGWMLVGQREGPKL